MQNYKNIFIPANFIYKNRIFICIFRNFVNSTLQNSPFSAVFLLVSKICCTFAAYTTDYSFVISFSPVRRDARGCFFCSIYLHISKIYSTFAAIFHKLKILIGVKLCFSYPFAESARGYLFFLYFLAYIKNLLYLCRRFFLLNHFYSHPFAVIARGCLFYEKSFE